MVNGALSFEKRTRKPRRALCYDDFAVPVGASAKCLVVSPWYEVYRRRRRSQTLRATEGLSEPNGVTLASALLARTDEVTEERATCGFGTNQTCRREKRPLLGVYFYQYSP